MGQLLRGCGQFGIASPNESYSEYQEPPTYTISAEEYAQHLKNEIILQCFMEHGVHSWEGFEDAMQKAQEDME